MLFMATRAAPLALREFTLTGKMPREENVADWHCIRSDTVSIACRLVMDRLSSNARACLTCTASHFRFLVPCRSLKDHDAGLEKIGYKQAWHAQMRHAECSIADVNCSVTKSNIAS